MEALIKQLFWSGSTLFAQANFDLGAVWSGTTLFAEACLNI